MLLFRLAINKIRSNLRLNEKTIGPDFSINSMIYIVFSGNSGLRVAEMPRSFVLGLV